MTYVITAAHPDDAATLGPLHLQNWLRNYLNADAGIDESWIREHRGSSATAEGIAEWREFIEVANEQDPAPHFCRVVRSETEIVGYLCGHQEPESITLGPMYLLDRAQGHGLGGHMMTSSPGQDLHVSAWGSSTTTNVRSGSTNATASRSQARATSGAGSCPRCR